MYPAFWRLDWSRQRKQALEGRWSDGTDVRVEFAFVKKSPGYNSSHDEHLCNARSLDQPCRYKGLSMFHSLIAKLEWRRRLRAMAAIRSASVYRVGDRVVLCPQLLTRDGYNIDSVPNALAWPVTVGEMTQAITAALAASGRIVRSPDRRRDFFKPVIEAAQVRSKKAFYAQAVVVDVTLEAETLRLLPMQNDGPGRGFQGSQETAVEFRVGQIEEAARHLIDMLERTDTTSPEAGSRRAKARRAL